MKVADDSAVLQIVITRFRLRRGNHVAFDERLLLYHLRKHAARQRLGNEGILVIVTGNLKHLQQLRYHTMLTEIFCSRLFNRNVLLAEHRKILVPMPLKVFYHLSCGITRNGDRGQHTCKIHHITGNEYWHVILLTHLKYLVNITLEFRKHTQLRIITA